MLGLRYYLCEHCDAVHADVDLPARCGRCGRDGGALFADVTLTLEDAAVAYFAPDASR